MRFLLRTNVWHPQAFGTPGRTRKRNAQTAFGVFRRHPRLTFHSLLLRALFDITLSRRRHAASLTEVRSHLTPTRTQTRPTATYFVGTLFVGPFLGPQPYHSYSYDCTVLGVTWYGWLSIFWRVHFRHCFIGVMKMVDRHQSAD